MGSKLVLCKAPAWFWWLGSGFYASYVFNFLCMQLTHPSNVTFNVKPSINVAYKLYRQCLTYVLKKGLDIFEIN